MPTPATNSPLIDRFDRKIDYARLSVTDRCDFRCVYCMAETMQFLPRAEILSLEELLRVGEGLVDAGIRKIRLTGGEPLIRKNILWLVEKLAALPGLDELTLTTNGSRLAQLAKPLRDAGVRRINISIDSLQEKRFRELTRIGDVKKVLHGIDHACAAGFERIKLNSVILKSRNDCEIIPLVQFARERGIDIAFIEEMPLGAIVEHNRALAFCSSDEIRDHIETKFLLEPSSMRSNGPARYWKIDGSNTHIGFISPHSNNFCGDCNRIRVTVEGRLLLCLGNEHSVDLRGPLRERAASATDIAALVRNSMSIKPERHYFSLHGEPEIVRFMNATGG
ncbi:MAG: GTP 3',8-cyclase MoaA [Pseudomonadales bacterium]|nr:MAG: GTP 3',8-cyclase MoaA [Pseudomonadales bacterium]